MSQITNGIRSVLSVPIVYSSFQTLMGAKKLNKTFASKYIRPFSNMKVLDVGCGPAEIRNFLPECMYWGFDISERYINQAKQKLSNGSNFQCKNLETSDLTSLPKFDVVLALGLFHHLDDDVAVNLMELISAALKPGGRLVSFDPCIDSSQNAIASFLISKDRGQNVRDKDGYATLGKHVFPTRTVEVKHQAWIPYTHCFMECTKT